MPEDPQEHQTAARDLALQAIKVLEVRVKSLGTSGDQNAGTDLPETVLRLDEKEKYPHQPTLASVLGLLEEIYKV